MIRLIAAIDQKNGIAKNEKTPWNLPADLKYFKQKTLNSSVLMGRKTFESIGQPLLNRKNFVLTKQNDNQIKGVVIVNDLEDFLAKRADNLWIIGGESLFKATIGRSNELYLTRIDADFDCDRFFPEFENKFVLKSSGETQEENGLKFRFEVWIRK